MNVNEFRKEVKPNCKLLIDNQEFIVKEIIKFRFADGDFYYKCFLSNDYVLADDSNDNIFILVKEVNTPFKLPFPKLLSYDNKEFEFSYEAQAVAEKVWGEAIIKEGFKEKFWDYQAQDGSYLSLGVIDESMERMDFYGKIISEDNIKLLNS